MRNTLPPSLPLSLPPSLSPSIENQLVERIKALEIQIMKNKFESDKIIKFEGNLREALKELRDSLFERYDKFQGLNVFYDK